MNLNDQPYAYGNENWKSIQPKVVVPTQTLSHSFRHNEVKYFYYVHQSEPTTTLLDFMNVLADIASAFNDQSAENFTPSHVPRTNKILSTFPEWIKKKYGNIFFWPLSSSSRSLYYASVSNVRLLRSTRAPVLFLMQPKRNWRQHWSPRAIQRLNYGT